MHDSDILNSYKLRKLAALRTLYKLALYDNGADVDWDTDPQRKDSATPARMRRTPKQQKKLERNRKITRYIKAPYRATKQHLWKHRGSYGGGVGALGALAALYEGNQAQKSKKELANVLERLNASDRGLSAAQKRIKQLESRGFFDYLFGRNK